MNQYICLICGYIHTGTEAPESCPICDAPKDMFQLIEEKKVEDAKPAVNAFRCINCDYVHEGDAPPAICPVCGLDETYFEPVHQMDSEATDIDFQRVLILGGGFAGLSAAETLREMNDSVSITMITNEDRLPYYRLNLTRYLADDIDEGDLCIHGQYWYDEKKITVYKNRVITEIDREKKCIKTGDGLTVGYDRLIIALGAHVFIPPIDGISSEGIMTLRSEDDANMLKEQVKEGTRVFIMGGGVLGLEAAGALSKRGAEVTVGEGFPWLMPRQLNEKASGYVERFLGGLDIQLECGFMTSKIEKIESGYRLTTKEGRTLETDVIIVSTGVRPNTYLARLAGLDVNKGIVVNDKMQTSDKDIYAVGDISEHYGVAYGLWNIAGYQGKIAAMNVLGHEALFGGVPRSNALKVLDIDVFSIGVISPEDGSYRVYEKAEEDQYMMFIVKDSKVIGSIVIGHKDLGYKIKTLVEEQNSHSIDELEDILKLL